MIPMCHSDLLLLVTTIVYFKYKICSLKSLKKMPCVLRFTNCCASVLGFFHESPQYKNANIANFVLAVPLETRWYPWGLQSPHTSTATGRGVLGKLKFELRKES